MNNLSQISIAFDGYRQYCILQAKNIREVTDIIISPQVIRTQWLYQLSSIVNCANFHRIMGRLKNQIRWGYG